MYKYHIKALCPFLDYLSGIFRGSQKEARGSRLAARGSRLGLAGSQIASPFCTNGPEDEICFQSFLLRVKEKLTILKEIAVAKKRFHKFQRKWSPFFVIL